MIEKLSHNLIGTLAAVGLVYGLLSLYGAFVGAAVLLALLILTHERRAAKRLRRREEGAVDELRSAIYRAGDRRPGKTRESVFRGRAQ